MTPVAYDIEIEWPTVTVTLPLRSVGDGNIAIMVGEAIAEARSKHDPHGELGEPHRVEAKSVVEAY